MRQKRSSAQGKARPRTQSVVRRHPGALLLQSAPRPGLWPSLGRKRSRAGRLACHPPLRGQRRCAASIGCKRATCARRLAWSLSLFLSRSVLVYTFVASIRGQTTTGPFLAAKERRARNVGATNGNQSSNAQCDPKARRTEATSGGEMQSRAQRPRTRRRAATPSGAQGFDARPHRAKAPRFALRSACERGRGACLGAGAQRMEHRTRRQSAQGCAGFGASPKIACYPPPLYHVRRRRRKASAPKKMPQQRSNHRARALNRPSCRQHPGQRWVHEAVVRHSACDCSTMAECSAASPRLVGPTGTRPSVVQVRGAR